MLVILFVYGIILLLVLQLFQFQLNKKQKNSKTIIATITTGDYKTANQIWMATVTNSLRTISE